jgi:tetratricopeptide (TPR) repeat protein
MVNEHRPYLPLAVLSLVWMIPVGRALQDAAGSRAMRLGLALSLIAVLTTLGTLTWQRNMVFATRTSYWADVVDKAPSARAYSNYGLSFLRSGEFPRARELFEQSLALKPYWHITHINLGIVSSRLGDDARARRHFDLAVQYDQHSGWALAFRGDDHLSRGEFAAALADYEASSATSLNHYANARRMATAHAGLGNSQECYRHTARCFELDAVQAPFDIVSIITPYYNDPTIYQSGIDYLRLMMADLPDAWWVHENIGRLASRLGQTQIAEESLQRAAVLREQGAS